MMVTSGLDFHETEGDRLVGGAGALYSNPAPA
jgi:hypothetical protein